MEPSITQKLVVVFGAGQTILATHTDDKVVFSDQSTQLSFAQSDEVRQEPGIYDLTIKEMSATSDDVLADAPVQYELVQVFRSALPTVGAPVGKKEETTARQSPMFGADAPARERR